MADSPFLTTFDDLPQILPLFPLSGVLLLPGGELPLNVFEPRYLNLTLDILKTDRLMGIVQPRTPGPDPIDGTAPLAEIGCAGRLSAFQETNDGRLLIALTGVCRFRLSEEAEPHNGYRRAVAAYSEFRHDLSESVTPIDRKTLLKALRGYAQVRELRIDWSSLESVADTTLVIQLAMGLPFEAPDKQALLEASDPAARAKLLAALLDMAALGDLAAPPESGVRH